jgi:hypothetical protein
MKTTRWLTAVAVILSAACADVDPVGFEGTGMISAAITDDRAASLDGANGSSATSSYTGTLAGRASVELATLDGTWVDVTDARDFSLVLQAGTGEIELVGPSPVPSGTYARVRLTLRDALVALDAGASLGGSVYSAPLTLRVGGTDDAVIVEREIGPFTVSEDVSARLGFDLNSEQWLDAAAAEAAAVSDGSLQQATTADFVLIR